MGKKILTLDIGAANIALVEYELGAKGALTLTNYGIAPLAAPLDSGDAATILSPALLQVVREKGIRPGDVAISVSGQMVFPRFSALPVLGNDPAKMERTIRQEIEQNVPFPIDEMVYDSQILGDTPNGDKSVMIVAAKVGQIEAITDAVASVGFRPILVDVAPVSLVNAVRQVHPEGSGCAIILDIGAKTTSLIITEDDKLYNRSIPIAGNNITRDIAQALGCSQPEAEQVKLAEAYVSQGGVMEDSEQVRDRISKVCRAVLTRVQAEVSRSVNYYRSQQGGSAPVKLFLTGGTALLPQIDQFFAESLEIPVEYFNPFDFISTGNGVDTQALTSDVAMISATVGLALHIGGAARFAINLIPPSLLAARAEKAKIPVIAAAGVMLVAALGLLWVAVDRKHAVVRAEKDAVESRVTNLKGYEEKVKKAESNVVKAKEEADKVRALLASRSAAVTRLNAVRSALVSGMWLDRWEEGRITVRCWTDRWNAIKKDDAKKNNGKGREPSEITVAKLKGSAAVDPDSVKIKETTNVGKSDAITQFTVELKFK